MNDIAPLFKSMKHPFFFINVAIKFKDGQRNQIFFFHGTNELFLLYRNVKYNEKYIEFLHKNYKKYIFIHLRIKFY